MMHFPRITFAVLLLAGLLISSVAVAEKPTSLFKADTVMNVWPEKAPDWNPPQETERDTSDAKSRTVAGKPVVRLGNVSVPQLHIYLPKGDVKSETTIVICPGGGYSILAWDLEGTEIAELLNEIGVTAVVLKYRVPTGGEPEKWKAPVQDIQRSISLVRNGAIESVPSKRVGVLGFSAGGNASARATTATKRFYDAIDSHDEKDYRPDFAVLVYPAWLVEKDDPSKLVEGIEVTKETPPVFFAHARDDGITCLGSVTMFTKLQQLGSPSELHVFGSGGHGFGSRPDNKPTDAWPELLHAWLVDRGLIE